MKNWKEYVFDVNGFQINTVYSGEAIETGPETDRISGGAAGSGKDDIVQVSGISGFAA